RQPPTSTLFPYTTLFRSMNPILSEVGSSELSQKTRMYNILTRPHINIEHLAKADQEFKAYISKYDKETLEQAEIKVKYDSYFEKDRKSTRLNSSHVKISY